MLSLRTYAFESLAHLTVHVARELAEQTMPGFSAKFKRALEERRASHDLEIDAVDLPWVATTKD